jgi:predicted ribosome quality control (RQC) complex YloA/Tae2 family protein
VHNNYYFLRQLSKQLNNQLADYTLVSCFTQNKEELIFEFNNTRTSFFIKASLHPSFCCLSFPVSFNRAKKNSVDLFDEIVLKKVISVRQFSNERCVAILLEEDYSLLFKMHGNYSNVVLLSKEKAIKVFRNQFQEDLAIRLAELDRTIDWSRAYFDAHYPDLAKAYFTFGKDICQHLKEQFSKAESVSEKWNAFNKLLSQLEKPDFYLVDRDDTVTFSLLPADSSFFHFTNPIEALNEFFHRYTSSKTLLNEKTKNQQFLAASLKSAENYLLKNQRKLNDITNDQHYQLWADLIMANMHVVKIGMKTIKLTNFYTGAAEEIKLKSELNAQQNAEVYYRKAKNQQIEINKLKESILFKEKEIERINTTLQQLEKETDVKSIRMLMVEKKSRKNKNNEPSLPYHIFNFNGFQIWVGRNAVANDELTLKFSYKEDLWLHAKDVAGSHVLIKHQSGKKIPKEVIERAAELAAYNSKRKTESLCPVIVTPKKFVRKRKGDPAGAVVVEKEEVILVQPKL